MLDEVYEKFETVKGKKIFEEEIVRKKDREKEEKQKQQKRLSTEKLYERKAAREALNKGPDKAVDIALLDRSTGQGVFSLKDTWSYDGYGERGLTYEEREKLRDSIRNRKKQIKKNLEYSIDKRMEDANNIMFSDEAVSKYTKALKHFKVQKLTRSSMQEFVRLQTEQIVSKRPKEETHDVASLHGSSTTAASQRDLTNAVKEHETRKNYVQFIKH